MQRDGLLFILVGPSGAGKNTLMRHVQQQFRDLPQLATATTRPPRPGEQQGREHLFVTHEAFQRMIAGNELIEFQNVHMDDYYGTPRQTVEEALDKNQDLIADIEFLGAERIQEQYPENTVLIFVAPTSLRTLEERIRMRGNITPEEVENRLKRVRFEMTFARKCDYLIINDILEPAAEHLRRIIISERHRRRKLPLGDVSELPRPVIHSTVSALVASDEHLLVRAGNDDVAFPSFQIDDVTTHPSLVLEERIAQLVGQAVVVDEIVDDRFTYIAPHHVELAAIPHDVYLYFYYRCSLTNSRALRSDEWEWRHIDKLRLPQALRSIVASSAKQTADS